MRVMTIQKTEKRQPKYRKRIYFSHTEYDGVGYTFIEEAVPSFFHPNIYRKKETNNG